MEEAQKDKQFRLEDLPEGLRTIAQPPSQEVAKPPADSPPKSRPKTQKEQELEALIEKRKQLIQQLKEKNPLLAESRKNIAQLKSQISGKGGKKTARLIEEVERLEFSIATEAYTPKQEKELIKKIRLLNEEIARHKEVDELRKKLQEEQQLFKARLSEIKVLEHELALVRKACSEKYAEVLAERKAAYEKRKQEQLERLKKRVQEENEKFKKKKQSLAAKAYDDTVTLDQIAIIERKEKKNK
ncbi:MAG: hypothetical protein N3G80_04075 [Candidatus Micrarchaeota archaeon]|nr:hypothetical protein [Candidatus Micrarchaeota archaeon]